MAVFLPGYGRAAATADTALPAAWRPSGPAAKVAVAADGVYRLTAAQLAAAFGVGEKEAADWLRAGRLQVSNLGQPVATEIGASGLDFFGVARVTAYTGENVYWITRGAAYPAKTVRLSPAPETPGATMPCTVRLEEQNTLRMDLLGDAEADPWMWRQLDSGGRLSRVLILPFALPGRANGGRLTLRMVSTIATMPVTVAVTLNREPLGRRTMRGLGATEWTFELADEPAPVDNTLALELNEGPSVCLDRFAVTYARRLLATSNELAFTAAAAEPRTVGGFASPDIEVFETTRTADWRRVEGAAVTGGPGDYRVSFLAPAAGRYFAVAGGKRRAPASVAADTPSDLASTRNAADHLVITVPRLAAAADALVAYRHAQGLASRKVYVEDIYDEFSHGIRDATAIRRFLAYAQRRWATPPRYVVLLGEGSVDYRNVKGYGDCLVPPLITATEHGLVPTDVLQGDLDGDGVPEVAVGRVPVMREAEGLAAVAKIRAYEAGGAWKQRALLVADNPDYAGSFEQDSETLAPRLAGRELRRIYLDSATPLEQSRASLLAAINDGCGLMTYVGHASAQQFAFEGLLVPGDVATNLTNASRPLVLAALTCLVAHFGAAGADSIGEQLMSSSNGAVAIWGTGMQGYNDQNVNGGRALLAHLYAGGVGRLGDAVLAAFRNTPAACRGFTLLGDPALAMGEAPPAKAPRP